MRGLRLSVKTQTLCGRASLEPEASTPGSNQHSERAAVIGGGGLYRSAQAGDAFIQLPEFDQAIAEVHAGAVVHGVALEHAPEAFGRAREVAFILQGNAEADQGVRIA